MVPSLTLTVYFGAENWDGPLTLFDMIDEQDPRFLACLDNYRVHLIAPAMMSDADIMKFQSSLREVMFFIKYSKDKETLNHIIVSNEDRFKRLERREADVIRAVTNSKINYDEQEECVDMCQAIQDMCKESEAIGMKRGIAEGRAEGIVIGESQKAQQIAKNLYSLGIDIEKIAQGVGCATETVKEWLAL